MCWEGGHFKEPSSPHLGGHVDSTPACSGSEQRPWLRGCPASDGERLTLRRSQSWRGTTLGWAETRRHEAARSQASGRAQAGSCAEVGEGLRPMPLPAPLHQSVGPFSAESVVRASASASLPFRSSTEWSVGTSAVLGHKGSETDGAFVFPEWPSFYRKILPRLLLWWLTILGWLGDAILVAWTLGSQAGVLLPLLPSSPCAALCHALRR